MPEFGEIMAELRQDAGMTQKEIAEKLFVGKSTISNYETGQRRVHAEFICQVAAIFNVSTDYLLGLTEFKEPLSVVDTEYIDGKTVNDVLTQMLLLGNERRRILCAVLTDMLSCEKNIERK